jgi:hypothetical protein
MATYRMVLFGPLVATQGRTAPGEARHWLLQLNAPDTCRRRWPFNSGAGQQYLLAGTVPALIETCLARSRDFRSFGSR